MILSIILGYLIIGCVISLMGSKREHAINTLDELAKSGGFDECWFIRFVLIATIFVWPIGLCATFIKK